MEDFKHKLMVFLNKQGPRIPSMGFSDSDYGDYHFSQTKQNLSINSKTAPETNRPDDQDILESIEAAYFSVDESYDICRFELEKLSESLECDKIQIDFKNLKRQHEVVSKKVLQLILQHQNSCDEEFKYALKILDNVKEMLSMCKAGRRELHIAKSQFNSCLGVLANYRKRKLAQNLLTNLHMIKNLHTFEKRLNNLLNEGDYIGAILELKRCEQIANQYKHFKCVALLTHKLQETLENTDSQLDRVLSQTCIYFDGDRYSKLQAAYSLLKKSQISMIDNLHVHYITSIFQSSLQVVQTYVDANYTENAETTDKNPYKTACKSVPQNLFIPCLIHLCKVLFKIVVSYHKLNNWYNSQESDLESHTADLQKLEHYLPKIWDDVQRKVSNLLLNAQLTNYKLDQFLQILNVVHRLIQVGSEFCSSSSTDLQESIRKQSANYFSNYHKQRLDELRLFMENEVWGICPVKSSFSILELQEYKSLKNILKNFKLRPIASPPPLSLHNTSFTEGSSSHSQDGSSITGNYFMRYAEHGTPFDSNLDESHIDEDILADIENEHDRDDYFSDDSDECEDLKKNFVDENVGDIVKNKKNISDNQSDHDHNDKTILTNTTLSVLRQMGNYLQMSRLLKPIAHQVIISMNELYNYYLYAVHLFFTSDLTLSSSAFYTSELNTTLQQITTNLIINHEEDALSNEKKIEKPILSSMVILNQAEKLHGLTERIVAVESLIFLSRQYEFLQEYLEFLVPNKAILNQFFIQNIKSATDLRKPVYMAVVAQAFDLRQVLIMMSKINWSIKDVMSQHNGYVDILLREVHIFSLRLQELAVTIPIHPSVRESIWECVAHVITHTLVQGFSEAKKCSNGGRALMQLDFTQFLLTFEKLSQLRPTPHKEYVENYVKAYYLPETEFEKWIREHKEYSSKHKFGLISCVCQNNKKTKQRFLQILEEIEKES